MTANAASFALSTTGAHTAAQTRPGKLPGLQILRFCAAFAVVLFHLGEEYRAAFGNVANPFAAGAAGVGVFFVLSGFIIALTTDPARGPAYFLRRRLARIVLLYWTLTAGLVLVGLVMPSLLNSTVITVETVLKSLLFIPFQKADGAVQPILLLGWTLNYEMFFYVIYAACLAVGMRSRLAPVLIVIGVVVAGWLWRSDNVLWRFYTSPLVLEFAMGIALYLLYARRPGTLRRPWVMLIGAAVLFALLRQFPEAPRVLVNGLPAIALVAAFIRVPASTAQPLSLLVLLGDTSYSLYLAHPYVIRVLTRVAPDRLSGAGQVALGMATAAACVVLSVVLYRTLELPGQRLLAPRRA